MPASLELVMATTWPLPPGQYAARLLTDDGYHSLGLSPRFRIVR